MVELNVEVYKGTEDTTIVFQDGEYEIILSADSFAAFVKALESCTSKPAGYVGMFSFGISDEPEDYNDIDDEVD